MSKPLKLYDIPEHSKIYEEVSDGSKFFMFEHVDGMYSLCVSEKGGTLHLSAVTPVEKYEDGYKFVK